LDPTIPQQTRQMFQTKLDALGVAAQVVEVKIARDATGRPFPILVADGRHGARSFDCKLSRHCQSSSSIPTSMAGPTGSGNEALCTSRSRMAVSARMA